MRVALLPNEEQSWNTMMTLEKKRNGILYVVATPIGNLEDITFRAVRILKEVDLIAAEDTRHSRKLLSHFDIHTPLLSYFKDKEKERTGQIMARLLAGDNVALVSDAGTPGISDPGDILVRAAVGAAISVVPVPGPSALTATLSVAGIGAAPFVFYGFLPATKGRRRKFFADIVSDEKTCVFYESPKRITAALTDCLELLGDRQMFMARELTKVHEETISGLMSEVLAKLAGRGQVKGECVVILAGAGQAAKPGEADVTELLRRYRDTKRLTLRDAVRQVSEELGVPRGEVYKKALAIWKKE